jgi:hypothetical protein
MQEPATPLYASEFQQPPGNVDPLVIGLGLHPDYEPVPAPPRQEEPPLGPTVRPSLGMVAPMVGALIHKVRGGAPREFLARGDLPTLSESDRSRLFYCQGGYTPDLAVATGEHS